MVISILEGRVVEGSHFQVYQSSGESENGKLRQGWRANWVAGENFHPTHIFEYFSQGQKHSLIYSLSQSGSFIVINYMFALYSYSS